MKMSDKFDLPLRFNSTPFLKDDSGERPIYFQFVFNDLDDGSRIARAKFACHAINNYDRITEENAKLRKMLTQLQIEGGLGIARHRQIDRLLNQLKEQTNDK